MGDTHAGQGRGIAVLLSSRELLQCFLELLAQGQSPFLVSLHPWFLNMQNKPLWHLHGIPWDCLQHWNQPSALLFSSASQLACFSVLSSRAQHKWVSEGIPGWLLWTQKVPSMVIFRQFPSKAANPSSTLMIRQHLERAASTGDPSVPCNSSVQCRLQLQNQPASVASFLCLNQFVPLASANSKTGKHQQMSDPICGGGEAARNLVLVLQIC